MILGLSRFCIVGILSSDACCLDCLKLVRFDSNAQLVKPGRVDEALRLCIRGVLWLLMQYSVFTNTELAMLCIAKGPASLLW